MVIKLIKSFTHLHYHEITQQVDMTIVIVCDLYSVSPHAHGSVFVTLSMKSRRFHDNGTIVDASNDPDNKKFDNY